MKKKSGSGLTHNLLKIFLIIPALMNLTASLLSHARFEAEVMKKHIVYIFILGVLFFVLLLSVWLCGVGLFVAYLLSLNISIMLSITLALIINLLLFIIICLMMMHMKIDPSFPETRKVIKELMSS